MTTLQTSVASLQHLHPATLYINNIGAVGRCKWIIFLEQTDQPDITINLVSQWRRGFSAVCGRDEVFTKYVKILNTFLVLQIIRTFDERKVFLFKSSHAFNRILAKLTIVLSVLLFGTVLLQKEVIFQEDLMTFYLILFLIHPSYWIHELNCCFLVIFELGYSEDTFWSK